MDETNRTVPHSTDAEKSVLGSILLSSLAAEKALEVLNAEDFFPLPTGTFFRHASPLQLRQAHRQRHPC